MDGLLLFYEQFSFEVAMVFSWLLLMSGLEAAIVPGAIVGSAVGGIIGIVWMRDL